MRAVQWDLLQIKSSSEKSSWAPPISGVISEVFDPSNGGNVSHVMKTLPDSQKACLWTRCKIKKLFSTSAYFLMCLRVLRPFNSFTGTVT